MKKGVILSFVFLISVLSFVSGAVFINEVEFDFEGSDTNNEWVEIYNDGASSVDLTGWYITDKDDNQFFFPSASISAGGFFLLDSLSAFVNGAGDSASLFNELNETQDTTGLLIDDANDNRTWQRVPDGSGDFVFRLGTKGVTNVDPADDGLLLVPSEYGTIQEAIDAAGSDDVIDVAAGTYVEDLVIPAGRNGLILMSNESAVIMGVASVPEASFPLADPNIEILSEDVMVTGFVIESPDFVSGRYSSGVVIGAEGVMILDNEFLVNSAETLGEVSQAIQTYHKDALSDVDISDLRIVNNTFTHKHGAGVWGYEGIYVNPDEGTRFIDLSDNVFSGEILRAITAERSRVNILRNDIRTDLVPSSSDLSSAGSYQGVNVRNLDLASQTDVRVNDNFIGGSSSLFGFDQGVRIGQSPDQSLSRFDILRNDLMYNSRGLFVRSAASVEVSDNSFEDNVVAVENNDTFLLDAEDNYWGICSGPVFGVDVIGNVDFDPWLGICITDKQGGECSINGEDVTLLAAVVGQNVDNVVFSYTIDGVSMNGTGSAFIGDNYTFTIPGNELVGGTSVSWNVFVTDTSGIVFGNGEESFVVRENTLLNIVPGTPDGLNDWYTVEPVFGLTPDPSSFASFYQWGTEDSIQYTGSSFGLEDAPNDANETGGSLTLRYWSDFGICGNESLQETTFNADLAEPVVKNLVPADGSLVVHDLRPPISALIDDRFQSNSGIDESSVLMLLDGTPVVASVQEVSVTKTEVSFVPDSDLSFGEHVITLSALDNAGHLVEKTWSFEIVESPPFALSVNNPLSGLYTNRRVPFNISLTEEGEIEYINYDDSRPRWRRLCRNCEDYGAERSRTRSVNEGTNNISFRGMNDFNEMDSENVVLTVDSRDPAIRRTNPTRGFSRGFFDVEFQEENPNELFLSYGLPDDMRHEAVDLGTCFEERRRMKCNVSVDLGDFEAENVQYWFNLSDVVGNEDVSRLRSLEVDTLAPVVHFFNYTLDGRRVEFVVNVSDVNFDAITYFDAEASHPRERNLCTRLRDGVCKKRKSFRRGNHDLTLRAYDEAGNVALVAENIVFEIL